MVEGLAVICAMLIMVFLGVPIAFSLLTSAFVGFWLIGGLGSAIGLFTEVPKEILANYTYSVFPMFIFMGQLANELGTVSEAYYAARCWLSFSRGGVLSAVFMGGAIFGAISGSSVAAAGFLAKVTIPELRKFGYNEKLGLGAVAAAGTLDALIPPSIMMVVFSMVTGVSLGKLLIAGIVPGLILTVMMITFLEVLGRVKPSLFPVLKERVGWKQRIDSVYNLWGIALIFILVFGGIFFGMFTPTAGGAIGALAVLLLGMGKRKIGLKAIAVDLKDTTVMAGQVFFVVLGGLLFSKVIVVSGMVTAVVKVMGSLPPLPVVLLIIFVFLILGALLDPVSMVVIGVPISFRVMLALGFHELQIGIMCILLVGAAVLTPPVGFNCYIVASAAGVDPMVVFEGMLPYFLIILIMIGIVLLWPEMVLWLPSLMF